MPGAVLRALHVLTRVILTTSPLSKKGNCGSERVRHSPTATRLLDGSAGTGVEAVCLQLTVFMTLLCCLLLVTWFPLCDHDGQQMGRRVCLLTSLRLSSKEGRKSFSILSMMRTISSNTFRYLRSSTTFT